MGDQESALQGMNEDLGSHRLDSLPLDSSNRRGEPTFQLRGGRVKVIITKDIQETSNAWNAAVANGEFDDDDAQAVKGLSDLGGPRPWAGNQRPFNQTVQQARKPHPRAANSSGTTFRSSGGSSMPTTAPMPTPASNPQACKPPAATQTPKAPVSTGTVRSSKPVLGLSASRWAPHNIKAAAVTADAEDDWCATDNGEVAKPTQDLNSTVPAMPTDAMPVDIKPLGNGTMAQPKPSVSPANGGSSPAVVSGSIPEQAIAKSAGLELEKVATDSTMAAPVSTAEKGTQMYPQGMKNMIDDPVRGTVIMPDWVRKPCMIFITAHREGNLTLININLEGDQPRSHNPLDLMEIRKTECTLYFLFRTELNELVSYCVEFEDVKQCEAIHQRIMDIHTATRTALAEDIAMEKAKPVASSLIFNDDAPTRAETPPMPSNDPSEAGCSAAKVVSQSKIPPNVDGVDKKPMLSEHIEKKQENEEASHDLRKGGGENGQGEKTERVTYTAGQLEEMRPLAVEPETPVNKVIMSYMDPKNGNKVVLVPRSGQAGKAATPVKDKSTRAGDEPANSGDQSAQHDPDEFYGEDEVRYPQPSPKATKEEVAKTVAKHIDWLFADPSSRRL